MAVNLADGRLHFDPWGLRFTLDVGRHVDAQLDHVAGGKRRTPRMKALPR